MNKILAVLSISIVFVIVLSSFNSYLLFDNIQSNQVIDEKIDVLKNAVEEESLSLKNALTKIEDIESTSSSLSAELSDLSSQTSNIFNLSSTLSSQLNSFEENTLKIISDLKDDLLAQNKTLNEAISETREGLNQSLTTLKTVSDNINKTNIDLKDQIEKIQSELSELDLINSNRSNTLLEQTPAKVYENAYKSVVVIRTDAGQGSGFIYNKSNIILTNWHVVSGPFGLETNIEVEFHDRTRKKATIIGVDAYSDIAVIMVSAAPNDVRPLDLGNSSELFIGQQVVAIGNPLGLTGSLSSGLISQLNRIINIEGVPIIVPVEQLDITIAPGSSGGPLFDLKGNVVGITNAGSSAGFNFAVPSAIVQRVATSLIDKGYYRHPFFGFTPVVLTPETIRELNIINLDPFQTGLLIWFVEQNLPADEAGLRPVIQTNSTNGLYGYLAKDIITAIDGQQIIDAGNWLSYVSVNVSPTQPVTLTVWSDGDINSVIITPTYRPPFEE